MIDYALNVYNNKGFLYQVDVFSSLKEVKRYVKANELEDENEFYKVICTEYNEKEQELEVEILYEEDLEHD